MELYYIYTSLVVLLHFHQEYVRHGLYREITGGGTRRGRMIMLRGSASVTVAVFITLYYGYHFYHANEPLSERISVIASSFGLIMLFHTLFWTAFRIKLEGIQERRYQAEIEERSKLILDAIPDTFFRVSKEGIFLDARLRTEMKLLREPEEYKGLGIPDVLPEELVPETLSYITQVAVNREIKVMERLIPLDGRVVYEEARYLPYGKDEVVIAVRDITERKQDEKCKQLLQDTALHMLQEKPLEDILALVCSGLAEIFRFRLVYIGFKEGDGSISIRAQSGEAEGFFDGGCVWWDDGNYGQGLSGRAIRTGEMQKTVISDKGFEPWHANALQYGLKAGISFPMIMQGQTQGALTVYGDKPEFWNDNIIMHLKHFVDQATVAVNISLQRQLVREAQEQVVRSEKLASLGTMAAGIAHEINQPLNSVMLLTSGLLFWEERGRPFVKERFMSDVRGIYTQAQRIEGIILQMHSLLLAQRRHKLVACCMNSVVQEAIARLREQIDDRGILVKQVLQPDLPPIHAQPVQLEQVVINLITNAMHALDSADCPDKEITVATGVGERVLLEVRDNGPGIGREVVGRIFEPFFTTKSPGEGMGLGLTIVNSIVTSYGGIITAGNNRLGGAFFKVEIPFDTKAREASNGHITSR